MKAGYDVFYRIYKLNEISKELDFHPLSITLLATVVRQNRWNAKRLAAE